MKAFWQSSVNQLKKILPCLDKKQKRRVAAAKTEQLGKGGVSLISVQVGISRAAIQKGLESPKQDQWDRIRRQGGDRKSLLERQPGFQEVLEAVISPVIRGDPESTLRWMLKNGELHYKFCKSNLIL